MRKCGIRARTAGVLLAMAFVLGLVASSDASAQGRIPEDARAFMKWCAERGFETKDSKGKSCFVVIGSAVLLFVVKTEMLHSIPRDKRSSLEREIAAAVPWCDSWGQRAKQAGGWGAAYARPVYDWLRAHPQHVRGKIDAAVSFAFWTMYRC
jgi:hypothetical protein